VKQPLGQHPSDASQNGQKWSLELVQPGRPATTGGEEFVDDNSDGDVAMAKGAATRTERTYQSSMGVLPDIQLHSTSVMNQV
jgi:hypothetical protein